jgi:putative membrane protein
MQLLLWVKALHLISLIAWFAGLFYLPRLFVYHSLSNDQCSLERFILMERRLYYYIMRPAALTTLLSGLYLLHGYAWQLYIHSYWLKLKLCLVILLYIFDHYLKYLMQQFSNQQNQHTDRFYRIINEIPTLLLISIIVLVIVRPF